MLATLEMKKLLDGSQLSEVQRVYTSNLPKEEQDNVGETIILVTDANSELGLNGNNTFHLVRRQVEIQIFYKLDIDFDIDSFEVRLMKLLKSNHWSILDIRGRTVDPDTLQMTSVIYAEQTKILTQGEN
ncbi:DUF806 family protein [uncultured Streptococcus sp.]|uniref:DUF806 family protein n=1 Tax=uncultured Streptococcus sp. TaxID=83427 RepID=UPI0026222080|nr:DUF806 family protein [uncultured Streptococcus sp.]